MSLPKDKNEELMAGSIEVTEFMKHWGFVEYLERKDKERLPFVTAEIMRNCIKEYWSKFEEHCFKIEFKEHFKKCFHEIIMNVFVEELNLSPFSQEFDDFKALLTELRSNTFWNTEKDPLFETESNKDFFNYVMQYFKDDKTLYKQRTLSYMYWRMKDIFYGKNALFIRYVNETYNDLKPLKKVLSKTVIESEYIIEQRNVLFNKAMKNWNEENPLFKKNFEPINFLN